MKERQVHQSQALVAHHQAAERAEPRDRALDDPSTAVAAQLPSILGSRPSSVRPVRADQLNTAAREGPTQRVRIVGPICDQSLRITARPSNSRDGHRAQRGQGELHLRRRGRGDGNSQRKTLAVDHHHALRTLAPLGCPDFRAPFFAGVKVPSINTFSQCNRPRASSSPRNARQIRSQTPRSSQRRSRRQQVEGLGYPGGRSRQRAPVFKTHRIPSITARLSIQGRPPLRLRRRRGNSGSILDRCWSVRRTLGPRTPGASAPTGGLRPRDRRQG